MDGTVETTALLLSLHLATLERCSSFVNKHQNTALATTMQLFERMEDWRRKKWPNNDDLVEEVITPAHREEIRAVLRANKMMNAARRYKKGDPNRLIESQANLADAVGTSQRMIARIIGNAKEDSEPIELATTSIYLGRVMTVLGLSLVDVKVRRDRAADIRQFAGLPDPLFRALVDAMKREK